MWSFTSAIEPSFIESPLPRSNSGSTLRRSSAPTAAPWCVSINAAALTVAGDGQYLLRLKCGAQAPVSERYVAGVRRALGVSSDTD